MKLILYHICCLCFLFAPVSGQVVQDERIYTVSEVTTKPEPRIGHEHFRKKWSARVAYPEEAVRRKIEGMVFVEFIVRKDGSITDAAVRSGLGFGCDEAALEGFIQVAKDPWKPATRAGEPVKVKMVLPFQFRIIKM